MKNKQIILTVDGKRLPIHVIKKEDWPKGKSDPTEYSSREKIVRVREDYDYKKDMVGWMRHELIHYLLEKKGFKDDGRTYPNNAVEREAYSHQFRYLKAMGYKDIRSVPGLGKDKYIQILKKYWDGVQ